jgi:hypothetical protein
VGVEALEERTVLSTSQGVGHGVLALDKTADPGSGSPLSFTLPNVADQVAPGKPASAAADSGLKGQAAAFSSRGPGYPQLPGGLQPQFQKGPVSGQPSAIPSAVAQSAVAVVPVLAPRGDMPAGAGVAGTSAAPAVTGSGSGAMNGLAPRPLSAAPAVSVAARTPGPAAEEQILPAGLTSGKQSSLALSDVPGPQLFSGGESFPAGPTAATVPFNPLGISALTAVQPARETTDLSGNVLVRALSATDPGADGAGAESLAGGLPQGVLPDAAAGTGVVDGNALAAALEATPKPEAQATDAWTWEATLPAAALLAMGLPLAVKRRQRGETERETIPALPRS